MKISHGVKILSALLMAMTTLGGCTSTESNGSYVDLKSLNIIYDLDETNHTYTVIGVKDRQVEDLDLPRLLTIDNVTYELESIGAYAFYDCGFINTITIPNSVTSIGVYAFEYCYSLESIIIPNSVTSIGYSAFEYCYSLTIYCEASSKPSGWHSHWNYNFRGTVYWGDEWHYENGVPTR